MKMSYSYIADFHIKVVKLNYSKFKKILTEGIEY